MNRPYRGRFAPSPTGPLHLGSLLAAVGSYLQARSRGGEWLVRLEDVDYHRCRRRWAGQILADLERLGFQWSGPVWRQSEREEDYKAALAGLSGRIYPCQCSRKTLERTAQRGPYGWIYPGSCRNKGLADGPGRALRLRVPDQVWSVEDPIQGNLHQNLAREVGDFVLRRADGLFSYQLAVVVDDGAQGVSEVVRGADLWNNTPRQRYLAHCLGLPIPRTVHLPVLTDASGRKLSKRDGAAGLDLGRPGHEIVRVLRLLGQAPPEDLETAGVEEIWQWAVTHWRLERVPRRATLPLAT